MQARTAIFLVLATLTSAGLATPAAFPTPVVVTSTGPEPVRVQIAAGSVAPCDSRDDRLVFDAVLGADETVTLTAPDACVCVRQTIGGSTIDWLPSSFACRPASCRGAGKARICTPSADPTIHVTVASDR